MVGAAEKASSAADDGPVLSADTADRQRLPTDLKKRRTDAPAIFANPDFFGVPGLQRGIVPFNLGGRPPSRMLRLRRSPRWGFADLEQIALQRNPTLVQAATQIEASRAKSLQAGLYPNPTIGYQAELIGVKGPTGKSTPGEFQGGFIQQEIVTAGKLRLSRAKYQQEARAAEIQAMAQQLRVVNGLHIAFYEVLTAQRLIENHGELVKNAEDAVKTTEEMVNVGQANEPDFLQAQVEANRERVALVAAQQRYRRSWQDLVTQVGAPELPPTPADRPTGAGWPSAGVGG